VERPLRLKVELSESARARFRRACKQSGEDGLADLIDHVAKSLASSDRSSVNDSARVAGDIMWPTAQAVARRVPLSPPPPSPAPAGEGERRGERAPSPTADAVGYTISPLPGLGNKVAAPDGGSLLDFNDFIATLEREAETRNLSLTAKRLKLIQGELAVRDEDSAPVIKKAHKPGKAEVDPIHGRFGVSLAGKSCVVEYEPDNELRDTEQVPLLEAGGIEAFFRREVLPYVPDAWIDEEATKIGYEISYTRHFYKPKPLRTLEEIRADIEALEKESGGLLGQIMVETEDAR